MHGGRDDVTLGCTILAYLGQFVTLGRLVEVKTSDVVADSWV